MLDGGDTLPPYDPAREQIVRAEIALETLALLEQRTTMLPSEYWGSVAMVRLDHLPVAVAMKVVDHAIRSTLRKVKGRWKPRLVTESLNEETTKMAHNSHDDLDWREELLTRLKHARHPALRAAHRALRTPRRRGAS